MAERLLPGERESLSGGEVVMTTPSGRLTRRKWPQVAWKQPIDAEDEFGDDFERAENQNGNGQIEIAPVQHRS